MYFECQYRVPYADTDQMGVVYYANYLVYFERGRTEMFRSAGLPYSELEKQGLFLPVSEAYCKYQASAHYDDLLTFRSWIAELGRVRVRIATEVRRADEVLVSGHVVLGCVNSERRIVRFSPEIIAVCRKFVAEGGEA